MAVAVKPAGAYLNFGNCLEISNEHVSLLVTVDVGPRIIRCSRLGGVNLMNNDVERNVTNSGPAFDDYYYKGAAWNIYGGHRLWISPESLPETYYPDNDAVAYEVLEDGAVFTPPAQISNDVQMKMQITLNGETVTVRHFITNLSKQTREMSPWALTVLNKGGLEIVPQNTTDTGLLANRRLILWPYANMADPRVYFGERYITLQQDATICQAFKIGMDNEHGWAMYILGDTVFIKQYVHEKDQPYVDYGASFETYTNEHILEMETLGHIYQAAPGQTLEHVERWSLYANPGTPDHKDEQQIDAFVKQFIHK